MSDTDPMTTAMTAQMTALVTALRIKGFAKSDLLAEVLGVSEAEVAAQLSTLVNQGLAAETRIGAKLSPDGQSRADALSAQEHALMSQPDWDAVYSEFHHLNGPFKQAIADWQIRDGAPNDHTDTAYDDAVRSQIADIHADLLPVLDRLSGPVPRLSRYRDRFLAALSALQAGDARMIAAPIIDSYHTVWFELHEDLIRLSGRTRAEEALAGRAV